MTARRAIDPIIATLLLIAIAVASGIIVYIYVNSLSGGLEQGGGQQVSEGLSMDTYSFGTLTAPTVTIRDTGGSSISINYVFFDGIQCQAGALTCTSVIPSVASAPVCTPTAGPILPTTCTPGQYTTLSLTIPAAASGTSHIVRIVTTDGGTFTFSIIAGRSG